MMAACGRRSGPGGGGQGTGRASGTTIAIVGAGPAGCSAALELQERGYDVTVFEKALSVGGKVRSHTAADGRVYEVGATSVTSGYVETQGLLRRFGIRTKPIEGTRYLRADRVDLDRTAPWGELAPTAWARVPRLVAEFLRVRAVYDDPGFRGVERFTEELGVPLEAWLLERGLGDFVDSARAVLSAIGYGYVEETSAAAALKYMPLWIKAPGWVLPAFRPMEIPAGFQTLWHAVRAELDARRPVVRLGMAVQEVVREPSGGRPTLKFCDGSSECFDKVILACPLRPELDPANAALLRKIAYHEFFVWLGEVRGGFPKERWTFYLDHCVPERRGYPVLAGRRYPESPLCTFFAMGDEVGDGAVRSRRIGGPEGAATTLAERKDFVVSRIREALRADNAELGQSEVFEAWHYFPHVHAGHVRSGFYRDLEALQGRGGVYLAGEILAFSTVESVVRYSRELVRRFFP